MINQQSAMKIMAALGTFKQEHPKFASFVEMLIKRGVTEGTVIEVTVTRPGEEPVTTNMKVKESDIELVKSLKDIRG